MRQKITNFLSSPTIRSSLFLSAGNLIASAISAIAIIITSRLLSPSQFGIFSSQLSLLLLLTRLADFGLNVATQRQMARDPISPNQSNIFQSGLILKLTNFLATLCLAILLSPFISQYVLGFGSYQLIIIIGILAIVTLSYDYVLSTIHALQKFALSNIFNITFAALKLVGVLTMLYTQTLNGQNTFYLYALIPGLAIFLGIPHIPKGPIISKSEFKHYSKILINIAKWTGFAMLAGAIADNVDILLIQTFLSSYDTGLYSAASRIAIFFSLIGMSIGTVTSIRVAKYNSQSQLNKYIRNAKLFAISTPLIMLIASSLSYYAIYFTSGPQYLSATPALVILMIATGIDISISPFAALFYFYDQPKYYFYSGILLMVTLITSSLLLIPSYGIIGAAIAKLITRIIILLFALYYTRKTHRLHFLLNKK